MAVTSMNAGSEQASAAPARARRAAREEKFFAAACSMRKKPHMKICEPRYLPTGRRCKRRFVGRAQARKPK